MSYAGFQDGIRADIREGECRFSCTCSLGVSICIIATFLAGTNRMRFATQFCDHSGISDKMGYNADKGLAFAPVGS